MNNNLGNIISDLPDVQVSLMTPETKAKNWYDKLVNEKALYDAYKKNPASFENNGVLSDEVYKLINGKK